MRGEAEQSALLSPQLHQLLQEDRVLLKTRRTVTWVGPSTGQKLSEARSVWAGPHLFAAGVEGLLQLLPGFWDEALLHGGEVMGILEGDLQLVSVRLQGAQEVLGEAA